MEKEKEKEVKEKRKLPEELKDFVYFGETSRSAMERGKEHFKDLQFIRSKSHMLKHVHYTTKKIDRKILNLE